MKKEFVKVNKSIFYCKRYIQEVEWLKYEVKRKITDILEKDFIKIEEFEESFDKLHIVLYNERLDIKLEVDCIKKQPMVFV